ncbi:MAG: MFS transporter [Rhodobacteraceae bacterium]|nr:MFS transporter [Paracoccaceae bacterium]
MRDTLNHAILALALFIATYAVNLQAPLYAVYAENSQVGAMAVTVAFAAYVTGLMPTLILLGGASDRIGRRVPIAMALCLCVGGTALLAMVPTWPALVTTRFILGVSTGFATTAGTAYMAELSGQDKTRQATLLVTSATSLGFGGGALATGFSLSLQGTSTAPTSFLALFVVAPVLVFAVLALPRADSPTKVPMVRLPVFPKNTWKYGVALAMAWSTTGTTIAVVPLQLEEQDLGGTGLVVFLAIFVGFLSQPLAKKLSNDVALNTGFLLVPLGYLILLFGVWTQSIRFILAGTAITSSASYGFTYLASLSEFAARAPDNRARAAAGLFVYAYVGFSLPTIASGALADQVGLLISMSVFAAILVTMTLAVIRLGSARVCVAFDHTIDDNPSSVPTADISVSRTDSCRTHSKVQTFNQID